VLEGCEPSGIAPLVERLAGDYVERTIDLWHDRLSVGASPADLMARRLLAKKFRKSPASPAVTDRVTDVVSRVAGQQIPLRLFVPCGGYKSPASLESPFVGWSELFAVAGFVELAAPICAVHSPGVVIEFSSDEAVVPRLTGAEPAVLARYRRQFDALLRAVEPALPPNLRVRQTLLRDDYDIADLLRRMEIDGKRLEEEWFPALAESERARLLRAAAHNEFRARASDAREQSAVLRRSVCEHQAYLEIDEHDRAGSLYRRDTVPIALRRGIPGWLHLGSNRRSATQFWVGTGAVENLDSRMISHILPPGRAAQCRPRMRQVPFDAPSSLPGLHLLPVLTQQEPRTRDRHAVLAASEL
jgi:hypothetical protein